MNPYCMASAGGSMVLPVNGDWFSFRGTKSNLRNVCRFANAADARKQAVMFKPRNVSAAAEIQMPYDSQGRAGTAERRPGREGDQKGGEGI